MKSNRETKLLTFGIALTSFVGATLYAKNALAKPKAKKALINNKGGDVAVKEGVANLQIETEQYKLVPRDKMRDFSAEDINDNDRSGFVYHQGVGSYLQFGGLPTKLIMTPAIANMYFNLYLKSIESTYRSEPDVLQIKTLNNKNPHYVGFSKKFKVDVRYEETTPQIIDVRRPLWAIHASDTGVRVGTPLKFFENKLNKYICAMLYAEGLLKGAGWLGGHINQQTDDLAAERVAMANVFMLRLYDAINAYAEKKSIKKLDSLTSAEIDSLCNNLFLGPNESGSQSPWSREPSFAPAFKKMRDGFDKSDSAISADLLRPRMEFESFEKSFLWRMPVMSPNCRHFVHPESMRTALPDWITGKKVKNVYLIGKTLFSDYSES